MRLLARVFWVTLVLASAQPKLSAQSTILGLLEDVPGVYAGEADSRGVRVVFQKSGDKWRAFPSKCPNQDCLKSISSSYPRELKWTISFDGKRVGEITGDTPKTFLFYSHIGLQEITSVGPVPTVGKKSTEFGGFTDAAVYRPLVTNSQPYFADPEKWKPASLTNDLTKLIRREFRRKFPKVTNCANPDDNIGKAWHYQDEDIKIRKTYSSRTKWFVAQVLLAEDRCDGPPDDPFIDKWFAISPAGEIKFLDTGMWLVDAGDYDNDGKSELVFSIDRYNRGGYELFYDDFKKRTIFEFGYH
jgi:hypothetical protein